jgi:hypothetical protein
VIIKQISQSRQTTKATTFLALYYWWILFGTAGRLAIKLHFFLDGFVAILGVFQPRKTIPV